MKDRYYELSAEFGSNQSEYYESFYIGSIPENLEEKNEIVFRNEDSTDSYELFLSWGIDTEDFERDLSNRELMDYFKSYCSMFHDLISDLIKVGKSQEYIIDTVAGRNDEIRDYLLSMEL